MQTKTEQQKFNGSRIGGCGLHNWPSTVDKAFLSHTRTSCTNNNNIPRQQKYNPISSKWKIFKFKENPPHQCMLLLHGRQNQKRSDQSGLLPYNKHACRLLYKATKRQYIQKNVKHHTEYAQHWKKALSTGVCWKIKRTTMGKQVEINNSENACNEQK